jgi:CRISPR-associated protein Csx17
MKILQAIRFDGIHADSLGHYFMGLGLLSAASRKWTDVRACWREGHFRLLGEGLSLDAVSRYLLESWEPTAYERWWKRCQRDPSKLWRERNNCPLSQLQVVDAHVVGLTRSQFNPVFGSGGNIGRRDLAKVWRECRGLCSDQRSADWLCAALTGKTAIQLPVVASAGTWFVFANKTFNSGQGWFREGHLSPWSFLLAIEGAFMLRGGIGRRLGSRARPYAVFPFVSDRVQPTTAGSVGASRGEFWAPLWECPASFVEVRALFQRGLARLGGRAAQAPHEFAVAALALGVDAGVSSFARFELRQTTSSQVFEAIPREQVAVAAPSVQKRSEGTITPEATLLMQLIKSGWLGRIPAEPSDAKRPGKFVGLRGPIEEAIVSIAALPSDPERWQRLLLGLASVQSRIDSNKNLRDWCRPLPFLRAGWFARAWVDFPPDEILLAKSIASVGARSLQPLLVNVFGVSVRKTAYGRAVASSFGSGNSVVWGNGAVLQVFADITERRLVDALPTDPCPITGTQACPVNVLEQFLSSEGALDLYTVARWIPAMALINWSVTVRATSANAQQGRRLVPDGTWLLYALFRPIFSPEGFTLNDQPLFRNVPRAGVCRRLFSLIRYGHLDEALAVAHDCYRAAGHLLVEPVSSPDADFEKLAAALLIPVSSRDLQPGIHRWLRPAKRTNS